MDWNEWVFVRKIEIGWDKGNEWNVTPTGERQVVMSGHGREAVAYDMSFNFHLKVTYFLSDAAQRVLHKFIQKLLKCV